MRKKISDTTYASAVAGVFRIRKREGQNTASGKICADGIGWHDDDC